MQIFEDFLNGPVFWTWELANDTVIMPWLAVQGSVNIPVQWGGHQNGSCDGRAWRAQDRCPAVAV